MASASGSRTSTTTPPISGCGRAGSRSGCASDGRRYLQTLKSDDTGGLVAYRGEWQTPLGSAEPDLGLLPAEASEVLDGLVAPGELRSLFTTRVRRQTRRLAAGANGGPPSLIEAALDLGAIEANGRSQPIAEIELELLEGSPKALYDLALELDALTPLQVETRSKSVRGYTLAGGEPPAAQKALPVELKRRTTVDAALGTILRACVQHWCANEAAALDGRDPEGVHQMRVALRRLRSALALFRRLIVARAARLALRRGEPDPLRPRRGARLGRVPDRIARAGAGGAPGRPFARGAAPGGGSRAGRRLRGRARDARRSPLHPLPAPARPLDRGRRLARGGEPGGGRLARPADRRLRRPAPRASATARS